MKLNVKLFAAARELAGADHLSVQTSDRPTVAEVRKAIVAESPSLAGLLASSLIAVNAEYAPNDAPISPGDDIAMIPPVSGG